MEGVDEPLDVLLEGWPPKTIEESALRRVEALVAEVVMSIADEAKALGRRNI